MPCGWPKNPPAPNEGLIAKAAAPPPPPPVETEGEPGDWNELLLISAIALLEAIAIAATWAAPKIGPNIVKKWLNISPFIWSLI